MTEFLETEEDEQPRPDPRRPVMSGHCAFPQTAVPQESHDRCERKGGGSRANPEKGWNPCPCHCHLGEQYECGNCGKIIAESVNWDGTGEMVYVHIDHQGNAISEDCS